MNRQNSFNTFQLYNDLLIHDQVEAVPAIELQPFEFHGQVDLTAEVDTAQMEFVTQTLLISRFQQSRPQVTVNLNGCTDDGTGPGISIFLVFSLSLCLCGEHFLFSLPCRFIQYDARGHSRVERFYLRRMRDRDKFIHARHHFARQPGAFVAEEYRYRTLQVSLIQRRSFV